MPVRVVMATVTWRSAVTAHVAEAAYTFPSSAAVMVIVAFPLPSAVTCTSPLLGQV